MIARLAGSSVAEIRDLNPQYLAGHPPRTHAVVRVPVGTGERGRSLRRHARIAAGAPPDPRSPEAGAGQHHRSPLPASGGEPRDPKLKGTSRPAAVRDPAGDSHGRHAVGARECRRWAPTRPHTTASARSHPPGSLGARPSPPSPAATGFHFARSAGSMPCP